MDCVYIFICRVPQMAKYENPAYKESYCQIFILFSYALIFVLHFNVFMFINYQGFGA